MHGVRVGVTGVAHLFGVREKTVYQWMRSKPDMPKRGEDGSFSWDEVVAWGEKHSKPMRRRG